MNPQGQVDLSAPNSMTAPEQWRRSDSNRPKALPSGCGVQLRVIDVSRVTSTGLSRRRHAAPFGALAESPRLQRMLGGGMLFGAEINLALRIHPDDLAGLKAGSTKISIEQGV